MTKHDCVDCDYMKFPEDNSWRIIYFCMFDKSYSCLEEVGVLGGCELDGFAEELYCEQIDE